MKCNGNRKVEEFDVVLYGNDDNDTVNSVSSRDL